MIDKSCECQKRHSNESFSPCTKMGGELNCACECHEPKAYIITREACEAGIKERENICDYCGAVLQPIETVDNSGNPTFWTGCLHGGSDGNFTIGVKPEIFDMAEKLVCDGEIFARSYPQHEWKGSPEERLYWFRQQVRAACQLLCKIKRLETGDARFGSRTEFLASEAAW